MYEELIEIFPSDRVAILHGQAEQSENEINMRKFHKHDADILLCTTMIEVGINIPNATTIIIEDASRFGLSQLHQLRGRVGRGRQQGFCFLIYDEKSSELSLSRLESLVNTNDGFSIAETDLKLRGAGDYFGQRQSGQYNNFKLINYEEILDNFTEVKKINKSLNAAFIDIGFEKDAFLHYLDLGPQFLSLKSFVKKVRSKGKPSSYDSFKRLEDINKFGKINEVLKKGDELLIQIVKEPISTKGPRVTTELSLAGRYLILVSFSEAINVSKKITNREERMRQINLIKSIRPKNFGVIVRTVAEKKSVSELDKDLKSLTSLWKEGLKNIKKAKVGEKVIGEGNKATSLLRDILNSSFDNIIIDDKKLFEEVKDYVIKFEPKKEKIVKYYSSPAPIFEVYGIEKQLQDLFGETVPISNGGYVIIQHTEALHAIDVNSGKTSKVSNQEEAALKVNLDAAETIARQLRLRDIGGIIVIDFIDLKKTMNKRKLFDTMKRAMSEDRSKHTILPLSKFCLMQITRQRVRQELKMTKEDAELDQEGTEAADKIEQKIEHLFVKQNEKNLTLVVHPYLYSYFTIGVLSRQYKWFIKHRRWVKIEKDNNIGVKDLSLIHI